MSHTVVPFFRPDLTEAEIAEVVETLRSGWLTTGPRVRAFETDFARAVGAAHALAVNSGTAALHLAVEALGLSPGDAVVVPTMTFAATAEVVRYLDAIPLLADCDPETGNLDLEEAARSIERHRAGELGARIPKEAPVVGVLPVHVGGLMLDPEAVARFARERGLWVVEDAAHAFPASSRSSADSPWRRCGENTSAVTCFSFYANKTITTGEGGMATTADAELEARMRRMALHGLSQDAWSRYSTGGTWDYKILAPGFKYNMTDMAAALGIHQLRRAEELRLRRQAVAARYSEALSKLDEIETPMDRGEDRVHSWHLYPIRLRLDRLSVDRNAFLDALQAEGIRCSVHWRPLHLHPYYAERFGWKPEHLPRATRLWERLISLPMFPSMRDEEIGHVTGAVERLCGRLRRR
jgi:perosamine synthetase